MARNGRRWIRPVVGAAVGLLSAVVSLAVAELVAGVVGPATSPVKAVGAGVVKLSPTAVTEFAKENIGTADKTYLQVGILVLLAVFAALLGVASLRRRAVGLTGVALFGVLGAVASVAQEGTGSLAPLPSILGAAVGMLALALLARFASPLVPAMRKPSPDGTDASPPAESLDPPGAARRAFLGVAVGAGAVAGLAWLGARTLTQGWTKAAKSRASLKIPAPASPARSLPQGVDLKVPGIGPWRTPNDTFYRIDTALTIPQLDADTWQLKIHGMVDHPRTISLAELLDRRLIERDITLTCVSNKVGGSLIGNARWIGAPLRELLREVGVHPDADQIVSRSSDGMTIGTPTAVAMDGRDAMLAVAMNGEPLPVKHGFPVRMVVPGLYGYVSACKWLVEMELTTFADYDAYWVPRGWDAKGPVKTESRIDTPRQSARLSAGPVMVGGVAWAQHRGIERVEVQVDDGAWQEARLASVPSTDTWRQWVYTWHARPGGHTLRVRATDRSGRTQTDRRAGPPPDGSTGWHTLSVTVS